MNTVREKAIKATFRGAIAACISGVLTTIIYIVAITTNASGEDSLAYWNDHFVLFDIGLIFLFAWFIYKKSRVAALSIIVYFLASNLYLAIDEGKIASLFGGIFFLYFYVRAAWGAFVFHRIEKTENSNYKATKKWAWLVMSPIFAIVISLFGIAALETAGIIPSMEVQRGSEVPKRQISKLRSEGIIFENENIEYFYSEGFLSVLDGGNILTDQEVISYSKNENGELEIYSIAVEDVKTIEMVKAGDAMTDAIYKIADEDPESWIEVWLSVENDGHLKFIKALEAKVAEQESD